jgi:hypothetical protein
MPGQKGNTNALKHGFYSRRFTKEVNEALVYARQDPLDEIACLRAQAIRVSGWLQEKDPSEFDTAYFTAVNTLANIAIAIGTLLRTQALITGKASNVDKRSRMPLSVQKTAGYWHEHPE